MLWPKIRLHHYHIIPSILGHKRPFYLHHGLFACLDNLFLPTQELGALEWAIRFMFLLIGYQLSDFGSVGIRLLPTRNPVLHPAALRRI